MQGCRPLPNPPNPFPTTLAISLCLCVQLDVMLPWMHGFDHDLPCQLKNSGLYKVW
jgi:hypothetical protein